MKRLALTAFIIWALVPNLSAAQSTSQSNTDKLDLLRSKFEAGGPATAEIMDITKSLLATPETESRRIAVSRIDYYLHRYTPDQLLFIARTELSDPSPLIRGWGVNTFRYLSNREEVKELMLQVLMNEKDAAMRRAIPYIIRGKNFTIETLDILKVAITDADWQTREHAMYALAKKPSAKAMDIIEKAEKVEADAQLKELAGHLLKDIRSDLTSRACGRVFLR